MTESTTFDPGPPPPGDLRAEVTAEQVAAFHDQGFVAVGALTTAEELEWLREVFDHLFAERVGGFVGGYFDLSRPYDSDGEDRLPQVLYPSSRVPRLRDTLLFRNARAVARALLGAGDDDVQVWDHMIHKPAHHGEALPWHQDEAYWDTGFAYRAIGCWTPLDDATVDNGCLHFLPGSHRGAVLDHRHIGGDPAVHGLEVDPTVALDTAAEVAVPVPAGSATFHHCRTLHSSGPNRTDGVRRAYAIEFQDPPRPTDDDSPRPWVAEGQQEWAKSIVRRRSDTSTDR